MHVKPQAGVLIRHPQTMRIVPPEGGDLPDSYARRRIRDGDAVPVARPAAVKPAPGKAKGSAE